MIKAGADGLQTVFLFNDQQIKEEAYVEDINMILNTADIPNLFPPDEKAELIEKMQVGCWSSMDYVITGFGNER